MKTETINTTKQANKVKNSSKLAQSEISKSLEKSINALDELSNTLRNKKQIETKGINLLNEVIKQDAKEQKKQEQEQKKQDRLERLKQETLEKGNYNRIVNGTNKIFKTNFVSLGYLLKIVSNEQEQVMQEQKQDSLFNEYDEIKLNKVFEIIKLARKNSDLYKKINEYKGIKSKKGNYSVYFLIRTINTNVVELQKLIDLQNWK